MSIFKRLSTEELDAIEGGDTGTEVAPVEGEVVGAVPVEEVIEAGEVGDEVAEIQQEISEDTATLEDAEEVVGELNTQIADQETMLETPENITEADVLISQEQLKASARILKYDLSKIVGSLPSHEAIADSPVTAMQLSTEGAKEFVEKVIAAIKALFKKIAASARALYAKLIVLVNRIGTNAQQMTNKLKTLKGEGKEFAPEKAAALATKEAVLIAAGISGKEYIAGLAATNSADELASALMPGTKELMQMAGAKELGDIPKIEETRRSKIQQAAKAGMYAKIVPLLETKLDPGAAGKEEGFWLGMYTKIDSTSVSFIYGSASKYAKGTASLTDAALKEVTDGASVKPRAIPELIALSTAITKAGLGLKTYSAKSFKVIEDVEKTMDTFKKWSVTDNEALPAEVKKEMDRQVALGKTIVVNAVVDGILGYANGLKTQLSIVSAHASQYGVAAPKEEKTEEKK